MKRRYTAIMQDTGVTFTHLPHRVTVIASSRDEAIRKMIYKRNAEWFEPDMMAHRVEIKKVTHEGKRTLRHPYFRAAVFQDSTQPTFVSQFGTDFWWGCTIRQLRARPLHI